MTLRWAAMAIFGSIFLGQSVHAAAPEIVFAESALEVMNDEDRQLITAITINAVEDVRALLPEGLAEVQVEIRVGDEVIPQTGEAGAAVAPGRIVWTVDAESAEGIATIARRYLRATLFHEMHHLVRGWTMAGGTQPRTILSAAISEGMAAAFARDFGGANVPWDDYPENAADWVQELRSLKPEASYFEWMFSHPDGRLWIGYRAGAFLIDRATASSSETSITLVRAPVSEILRLAEFVDQPAN